MEQNFMFVFGILHNVIQIGFCLSLTLLKWLKQT